MLCNNIAALGKVTTGLMVVTTMSQLYGNRPLSAEEKHLAFTLGWSIEIVSIFCIDWLHI